MITNPKSIPSDFKTIRGNIVVKNYFNKKGIPVLSIDESTFWIYNEKYLSIYLPES